jgi:broad specificity phosphatase PhoE
MTRLVLSLLLFGFLVSAAAAQSIAFIVRHAEKDESSSNDPGLSNAGRARAESLASMLKDAGVTTIYATEFRRTQETAAPLAQIVGLQVVTLPGKSAADFVAKLRELHDGNALVVGHSNTIPLLIRALGIDTPIKINDSDYDNLFVVTLDKQPRLFRLHFR